ncbi:hypothetical protein, partial [Roseateles sp.]|uniref:hypothetical protein n=1 Tax=Roseateles sp. TaxID=1971397 RepID=UPI002E04B5D0|nr:hypothetical protein [Roseateles sp.]
MRKAALALALALALAATAVPAAPVTGPDPAAEDTLLASITRRAYDDPEAMLAELNRRWPTHAGPGQPREPAWLL